MDNALQSLYQAFLQRGVPPDQIPSYIQHLHDWAFTGSAASNTNNGSTNYALLTGQAELQRQQQALDSFNSANEARAATGLGLLNNAQQQQRNDNQLAGDPFKLVEYLNNAASLPGGVAANPVAALIGAGVTIKPYNSDPQQQQNTQQLLQKMYGYANPTSAANPAPTGQARGGQQMLSEPVVGIGAYTHRPLFTAAENGPEKMTFTPQPGVSRHLDPSRQDAMIGSVRGYAGGGWAGLARDVARANPQASYSGGGGGSAGGGSGGQQAAADPWAAFRGVSSSQLADFNRAYNPQASATSTATPSDPLNGGDYRYQPSQGTYNSPNAGSAPLGNGSYIVDGEGHISAVANPDSTFQNQVSRVVGGRTEFHTMTPEERQGMDDQMRAQDTSNRLGNMVSDFKGPYTRDYYSKPGGMLDNMYTYGVNWGANQPRDHAWDEYTMPGGGMGTGEPGHPVTGATATGRQIAYWDRAGNPVYVTGGGPGAYQTAASDWSSGRATGDARTAYRPQMAGAYGGMVQGYADGGGILPTTAGHGADYDPSKGMRSEDNQMGEYATDMFNNSGDMRAYDQAMQSKFGGVRNGAPVAWYNVNPETDMTHEQALAYRNDPNAPGYSGGPNWAQTNMGRSPNPWGLNSGAAQPAGAAQPSGTQGVGDSRQWNPQVTPALPVPLGVRNIPPGISAPGINHDTPGSGGTGGAGTTISPAQAAAISLGKALQQNPFADPAMIQSLLAGQPPPPGSVTDRFRNNVDPTLLSSLESVNQGFGYRPQQYNWSSQQYNYPGFTGYYRAGQ